MALNANESMEYREIGSYKPRLVGTMNSRISVTPTHSKVTAGTSSGVLVAANANRRTIVVTNTHATQRVTLNFGGTAVLDTGITIMPNGSYNMGVDDYFSGDINVIASGATTVLSVAEF